MAGVTATEGIALICGGVNWATVNRKSPKQEDQLLAPHRIRCLLDIPVSKVISGPASSHSLLLTAGGECYSFGRNETSQLGLGDTVNRSEPQRITSINHKITGGACGRSHSIIHADDGVVFAFGDNKSGQCGLPRLIEYAAPTLVKDVAGVTKLAAGALFTMALTDGGNVFSFGWPEYGQLGHGATGEYFNGPRLVFPAENTPRLIAELASANVIDIACGNNHTIALTEEGSVFTWGFAGYGRLGHNDTTDLLVPKAIPFFDQNDHVYGGKRVWCGAAYSAVIAVTGQLYMFGKVSQTGEAFMYPKPIYELSNWKVRAMSMGASSIVIAAEKSCIAWGISKHGELGFGPGQPKSSASTPKKVDPLEDLTTLDVACGAGHTLFIIDPAGKQEYIDELGVYPLVEDGDDECGVCGQKPWHALNKMVGCDGPCEGWFHQECGRVPYKTLEAEEDWYCSKCVKTVKAKGGKRKASTKKKEGPPAKKKKSNKAKKSKPGKSGKKK